MTRYQGNSSNPLGPLFQPIIDWFNSLTTRQQLAALLVAVVAGALLYFLVLPRLGGPTGPGGTSPQMLLGNPSGAGSDRNNYLMLKPYYALSYNDSAGTPNWVSWRVAGSDLGRAPRKQTFDTDETLPAGFNHVATRDYSGSGFDRGHMCPHSDRAATEESSFATFVMTNIIPQAPNVNRKAWAQFESYCRELVSRDNQRLYIASGPVGRGGTGSKGPRGALAGGKVTVPAQCWKVVVAVPDTGSDDLAAVTAAARVITVMMPNDQTVVGEEWAGFRTSPAAVERQTGYRFFTSLPADVAETLRQKVDDTYVAPPRPMFHGDKGGGE